MMKSLSVTLIFLLPIVGALRMVDPSPSDFTRIQSDESWDADFARTVEAFKAMKVWDAAVNASLSRNMDVIPSDEVCRYLVEPSTKEYHLKPGSEQKKYFSQNTQDRFLAKMLPSNGFFIESGAFDGETGSNTLHFEMKGWKGLLVEPTPQFKMLLKKNRKAYSINAAMSLTDEAGKMKMTIQGQKSKLGEGMVDEASEGANIVNVFPVASMLQCLKQSTVDFWSLDVEGVEGKILQHFPFQKIDVGVMLVELNKSHDNTALVLSVLKENGFQLCKRMGVDKLFANPAYYAKRGLQIPEQCDIQK